MAINMRSEREEKPDFANILPNYDVRSNVAIVSFLFKILVTHLGEYWDPPSLSDIYDGILDMAKHKGWDKGLVNACVMRGLGMSTDELDVIPSIKEYN